MRGGMLPASILVFLTVNEWAGLQLAAHYRGAVVTHGRVPCCALWFRVTVDARDWREKEQSSSESGGRSRLLVRGVRSQWAGASRRGGKSVEKDHRYRSNSDGQTQQRSFNLWYLWKSFSITGNMKWKVESGFQSDLTGENRRVKVDSWSINTACELFSIQCLTVQNCP